MQGLGARPAGMGCPGVLGWEMVPMDPYGKVQLEVGVTGDTWNPSGKQLP